MALLVWTAVSILLLQCASVSAQTATNATCTSTYDWMSNAEGQSPCLVAADLQGVCNNDKWFIPALPSGQHYVGPTSPALASLCICNTVTYNLVSACAACQGDEWVAWADWTANCSLSLMTRGSFPGPVPAGTSIPAWALIDTSLEGSWNAAEARSGAASQLPDTFPSSTAGSGSTTGTSSSTATASLSTSPATDSTHSNVGAIAGGVVGGVAALILLFVLLTFFILRSHRRAHKRTEPIPLPASYTSLSSRDGSNGGGGGGAGADVQSPILPGLGDDGTIDISHHSAPYQSASAEKAALLHAAAHGHGQHLQTPPYSPHATSNSNSPHSPQFPPPTSTGTGTGTGTTMGTGTAMTGTTAAGSTVDSLQRSRFVLYDPANPATWPTNIPVSPVTPGSGTVVTGAAGVPHRTSAFQQQQRQQPRRFGLSDLEADGDGEEHSPYSPVPTPAPTYRSSASPMPGVRVVRASGDRKRRPPGW